MWKENWAPDKGTGALRTAIKTEERLFNRFDDRGDIHLDLQTHRATGKIINVSLNGVLGLFNINDNLPKMSKAVNLDLEFENKSRIDMLEGTVIRIQASQRSHENHTVEIALKFKDLSPQKRHQLKKFLGLMIKKTRGCPYFS
ncbi:MAG: PilZ domain-containing protein [Nitrospiraceae bacterium]|nr:PilZ domain-containing protein [Nitrospiraceae bacterium]